MLDFDRDRIRYIRARLGMHQDEFAKYLEVSINTVVSWENGHSKPTKGKILGRLLAAEREAEAKSS